MGLETEDIPRGVIRGYYYPCYQGLYQPVLIFGLPRKVAILFFCGAGLLVFGFKLWLSGALLSALVFIVLIRLCKNEPFILEILSRSLKHKKILEV